MRFQNRTEAGDRLADRLAAHSKAENAIVLALPRGGVAVAAPIAKALHAELAPFVVRKVGAPHQEELAMGAVSSGGATIRNESVLSYLRVSDEEFEKRADVQRNEVLRRELLYFKGRPPLELKDRFVVLIDDGLATGASMKAAVTAVRAMHPKTLIVAVPVASRKTADEFRAMLNRPGEEFVCLYEPHSFGSVGQWYDDFRQVEDEEVCELLEGISGRSGTPV
jgi:putative phosphoribosyl transferase